MDKALALEIIKILSALESRGFSNKQMLPDYLHDQLQTAIEELTKEVLHTYDYNRNVADSKAKFP